MYGIVCTQTVNEKRRNKMNERLKFKSYDGLSPNFCWGKLILNLDGLDITFPEHCLYFDGVCFDDNYNKIEKNDKGKWVITDFPENFPKELKERANELVNENMEWGCCGGCI